MKKVLIAIVVLLFLIGESLAIDLRGCYKKVFKVSAYYSPVWGQKFYYKGSYRKEIKLNGRGIYGASGQPVFNGMLAAPKSYKFGTKIYFPGLGVGEVADRGNAIVEAGKRGEKYDRIDIWVGKGDYALLRALSFGKKVMIGYVCPANKRLKVGFDWSKFPVFKNFFEKTIWGVGMYVGRKDPWVKVLQTYLKQLGFFNFKVTGYFGNITKRAVTDFQKYYGITTKYYGYFGPKTRAKLREILKQKGLLKTFQTKPVYKSIQLVKPNYQLEKVKKDLAVLIRGLGKGYNTYEVKILQKYLSKLGYYQGPIDGYYSQKVVDAVTKFQLDYNIINSQETYAAGFFGPKTRAVFKQVVLEKFGG